MSVNKLYICAVDDDDVIKRVLAIAKTSGGEFRCYENTEDDLNKFLLDAFVDGYGIAFKDDGDLMSPIYYLYPSEKEDEMTNVSAKFCPVCGGHNFRVGVSGGMPCPPYDQDDDRLGCLCEILCEKCNTIFSGWSDNDENGYRLSKEQAWSRLCDKADEAQEEDIEYHIISLEEETRVLRIEIYFGEEV